MAEETSKNYEKVLELIENMTVLELNDLVKAMEDKFGVSPVAAVAAQPGTANEASGAGDTAKTSYTVVLESAGAQKIAVIKAVRTVNPELGQKEAKDLVEGAPKTIAENIPTEDAQKIKKALEEAGATVTLK